MTKIETAYYELGFLDSLADKNTFVHSLDPRSKVLTTVVFIICVVSFPKYTVSQLLPFFIFPVALISLGSLPVSYFIKKIIIVSPFILFVAVFNPVFDRTVLLQLGPLDISGGWISFSSIMLRFVLTVGTVLILIATTGFTAVCMALERLGVPKVFVVQLLFLYRYIFVLIDEGARMSRARALRSNRKKGYGINVFMQLAGNLLLRTIDRAQRIHMAMLCRGFNGEVRTMTTLRYGKSELLFTVFFCILFICLRFYDISYFLGKAAMELMR